MNDTTTSGPASSPPPPPPPPPGDDRPRDGMNTAALGDYRALRRSATDRKLAGVAGGLARHLDVDPLLIRVLLVVLVFFGGAGILLYGVLWLLVPDERTGHGVVHSDESTRNVLVIVALVVAALIAFTTGIGGDSGGAWFLSVVVIGAVAYYLVQQPKRQRTPSGSSPGQASAPFAATATTPEESAYSSYSGYSQYDATTAPAAAGPTPPGTPPPGTPGSWGPVPPYSWTPRRKRGPLLFMPTLFLVALGAGVLGLMDSNGYDVPDAGYAALALATVGTMLVVGSFFGRAGGLVLLGLISLGALGATSIAEPSYQGSRDVTVRPVSTVDLKPSYDVPAGRIEIDLTELSEPSSLAGQSIEVDVNAGEIVVVVPPEVTIDLEADVRYGGVIDTPDGRSRDGWGTDVQRVYRGETANGRTSTSAPLELDLEAGFGHIDVRRG